MKTDSESYYVYLFNAPSRIQNEQKYVLQYRSLCLSKLKLNRGKKSMLAANHLKNLMGDTQNINESKINLDS